MTTYVYRPGHPDANERGMVNKECLHDDRFGESSYVISDTMEPTRHMATGKYHTSKSEFRKDTRASGCVEVGNETGFMLKPRKTIEPSREERRHHLRQAIKYLQNQ